MYMYIKLSQVYRHIHVQCNYWILTTSFSSRCLVGLCVLEFLASNSSVIPAFRSAMLQVHAG